jgi:hypothetical protein
MYDMIIYVYRKSCGGKVLIRSEVDQLLYNHQTQRIDGVTVRHPRGSATSTTSTTTTTTTTTVDIHCRCGVISSTGYLNTMNNLLPRQVIIIIIIIIKLS